MRPRVCSITKTQYIQLKKHSLLYSFRHFLRRVIKKNDDRLDNPKRRYGFWWSFYFILFLKSVSITSEKYQLLYLDGSTKGHLTGFGTEFESERLQLPCYF